MGSLFDGIGGFPLAAVRKGITTVWASEIEAFPIAVTKPEEILLVPMDATLIEQVLLNLLENVARHSPSATEIFIEIRDEGSRVWLTVADNGDGIPPQLLGVLFDGYLPLGAVEASDRSRHMGIGLSVCRAIVRAHGGEIYARNRVGGGAEFRFWLPAEEGHT